MLLTGESLKRILDGSVTLAFRRWTRPTVRSRGTLMTQIGQLEITSVRIVDSEISEDDAIRAGYSSREDLLCELGQRADGSIYRVELGAISPDPRIALRDALPDDMELTKVLDQLRRMDERSASGAWTERALGMIARHPAVLAQILANRMGMEKLDFKTRVRKLKALGLTISLEVGYRLSARGEVVLERLRLRDEAGR